MQRTPDETVATKTVDRGVDVHYPSLTYITHTLSCPKVMENVCRKRCYLHSHAHV